MASAMRQRNIRRSLACPICQKLLRQVTTIEECSHRFCNKCITKKITEEGLHNCPVCNVDLGFAPLQKLRMDYRWQKVLDEFNNESGFRKKSCEISEQEINRFDANLQTTEEYSSRTRTRLRNEKQKNHGDSLRGAWRPENEEMWHVEGKDDENVASIQSRDLRARRREEKNPIISSISTRRSRNINPTNVECNEKENTFWFSLVASNKQRCRAPLEQIPSRYLRVKDGNITVSSIKKYLMQKLNLRSENEVELSLQGRVLFPNIQMWKLVDLWLNRSNSRAAAALLEKKRVFVGSSARDFVLTLTYSRRPM